MSSEEHGEHSFPAWSKLEYINDETYITTIAGYHIVISRTGTAWKYSCDFAGIHDRPLRGMMACLGDIKKVALEEVVKHMDTRIASAQRFLSTFTLTVKKS